MDSKSNQWDRSKTTLLDRYSSHSKHSKFCKWGYCILSELWEMCPNQNISCKTTSYHLWFPCTRSQSLWSSAGKLCFVSPFCSSSSHSECDTFRVFGFSHPRTSVCSQWVPRCFSWHWRFPFSSESRRGNNMDKLFCFLSRDFRYSQSPNNNWNARFSS